MSTDDIAAIVTALGDLVTVVRQAELADKAEIYGQLGLTLTYQLERRLVEATIKPLRLGADRRREPSAALVRSCPAHHHRGTRWPGMRVGGRGVKPPCLLTCDHASSIKNLER